MTRPGCSDLAKSVCCCHSVPVVGRGRERHGEHTLTSCSHTFHDICCQRHGHAHIGARVFRPRPGPSRAVISPGVGVISARPCSGRGPPSPVTALPAPPELMLPKWGNGREKCDPLPCGVFWAAVRFPWKRQKKYGDEGPREGSTPTSVGQVKSKPASVALQAPPWNSRSGLFPCVATRSVRRAEGERAFIKTTRVSWEDSALFPPRRASCVIFSRPWSCS